MIDNKILGSITSASSGSNWDSAQLASRIAHRASILARLGVGPGFHALLCHGSSPEFFADLFAVWRLGACAACLSPDSTRFQVENVIDFLSPSVVLVDDTFSAGYDLGVPVLCCSDESVSTSPSPLGGKVFGGNFDSAALILFTSGTTGAPKGVEHSFQSVMNRIELNRQHIGDDVLTNTFCILPTHFGHGLIGNCLTPLFAGKNLVLAPFTGIKSAAELPGLIDSHGITFMSSVPAIWNLVLKAAKSPATGSLRQVSVGSAPLPAKLWGDIISWAGTQNVVNMYGITELANWVAGASALDFPPEDGLIGKIWGGSIAVGDDNGNLRNRGDGELFIKSPSLMLGYHRKPDLTAKAVMNGWYKTGDIGRIGRDGVVRLVGRTSLEINRAGIKIHPEEIESLLASHPLIFEACAFAIPDVVSGEVVGVAVCKHENSVIDSRTLRSWCLERLRPEQVPERWFTLKEIPKTNRGKIDRRAVIEICQGLETV